jgi:hypothetical protein
VTANKGDWYQGKTSLDYQYALNWKKKKLKGRRKK